MSMDSDAFFVSYILSTEDVLDMEKFDMEELSARNMLFVTFVVLLPFDLYFIV